MWVNSKTAAAVLSVDLKAIQQGVYRATKQGKNFCSVKLNILRFTYLNGIGRGGKVLQIWIDDSVIAEFESKNGVRVSINGISHGVGGANLDNGSLNTCDCFETHGVSRNDNRDGSGGGRGVVGGRGVAGNGEVVGNSLDCFVSCDTRNDNRDGSGGGSGVVGGRNDNKSVVGENGAVGGRNDNKSVSVGVENSKKKIKKNQNHRA